LLKLLQKLGYFPKTVVWELTLGCNLKCKHCGSRAGKARKNELTIEENLKIAHDLVDLGLERVTLSGGEPTLYPHWDTLGKFLVENGVKVNLISNGITWNTEYAQRAKDAGFESAAFSLDGFKEAHNFIRGVKNAYDHVLDAFKSSREVGLPISVVTTVYKNNLYELKKLRSFLHEEGVRSWQVQIGNPAGNMKDNEDLVIKPVDLLKIVPELAKLREENVKPNIYIGDNCGYFGPYEKTLRDTGKEIDFWLGCRAGLQVLGIESDGNIKGCLSLPSYMNDEDRFNEGNVRDSSIVDIWCNPDNFSYNRKFTTDRLTNFCGTCKYNEICRGGCLWTSFSHSGGKFDNPFCYYRVAVENGVLEP
jgi:radical SAM protein with 4Fe4S-binding SPASM domain